MRHAFQRMQFKASNFPEPRPRPSNGSEAFLGDFEFGSFHTLAEHLRNSVGLRRSKSQNMRRSNDLQLAKSQSFFSSFCVWFGTGLVLFAGCYFQTCAMRWKIWKQVAGGRQCVFMDPAWFTSFKWIHMVLVCSSLWKCITAPHAIDVGFTWNRFCEYLTCHLVTGCRLSGETISTTCSTTSSTGSERGWNWSRGEPQAP